MDYDFTSLEQLFKRVRPALHAKCSEFHRTGYVVKDIDIWNCLMEKRWKCGKGLTLYDIVNDIMMVEYSDISKFQEEKRKDEKITQNRANSVDVI